MSVTPKEIKYYGSTIMPDDDARSNIGGALDESIKIEFSQMGANSVLEAWTSNSDTPTLSVSGRDSAGVIVDDSIVLSGTTPVTGTQIFERILKVDLSGTSTGTVSGASLNGGTTWFEMESGITSLRVPFFNVSADVSSGVDREYYEKIFVKNTNSVTALTTTTITEVVTGASSKISFGISGPLNDSNTTADRTTIPPNINFQSGTVPVSGGTLNPDSAQGIWLNLSLAKGSTAEKNVYVLRTQGSTT